MTRPAAPTIDLRPEQVGDARSEARSPPPVKNCEVRGETPDPQPPEVRGPTPNPSHNVRMVPEAISGQAPRRCTGFPCSAPMKSRVVAPIHRRLIGCEPARRPMDQAFPTPITVAAGGILSLEAD